MKVRVLRAFCVKAERREPGSVVDLPDHVAREVVWLGKGEKVEATPEPVGPMTTESAPLIVAGKTKRKVAQE